MIKVSLEEAEGHLGELIEEAAAGQEVVITSAAGPTVRLTLVTPRKQETQGSYEPKAVGHALDRFIGTWSAEQEAEILKAVPVVSAPSSTKLNPGFSFV
jgi:prevent-host-death family protein